MSRIGLGIVVGLVGCGSLLSGYNQYCEEYVDCLDGNDEDEQVCVLELQESERIAKVYGCKDDFADYMDCMKEEADCESAGSSDYWTAEDGCEDEHDDYMDCLLDESDLLGGGDVDTGSWTQWDDGDANDGVGTGSEETEPTFNIAWTDDGNTLQASVSNPHVDGYFLGLAETGSGINGWYGEDCLSADSICHDMGASSSISLTSVHPDRGGAGLSAVVGGSTTIFHAGLWAGVTYVFFSNEGSTNYETVAASGGDDPSYYQ